MLTCRVRRACSEQTSFVSARESAYYLVLLVSCCINIAFYKCLRSCSRALTILHPFVHSWSIVAIPIGSGIVLGSERPPYGCDVDERTAVHHDPIHGELADCARALYYTRRLSEDLAHNGDAPEPIRNWAEDVAKYSNDLEFFARQLALSLKMPVMVEPPYLPVDMAAMPLALLIPRPPTWTQRSRLNRRPVVSRSVGDFL